MLFEDVWFRYGRRGQWVLRGVAAEVRSGQTVVVLGRNGVGKSTLLQLAAGVLRPSRGRVVDRPARVGWVPERFPADQPFTVEQYLAAIAGVRGLSGPAVTDVVDSWVDRLGLRPYHRVRLPDLSKGTAQKVGLAQAMLVLPGLLVLDEPWEGLDAATRELVPEIVAEVTAAGGRVMVSDHRGEISRLPGAVGWTMSDAAVIPGPPVSAEQHMVLEVAVRSSAVGETVARLRADGHHVTGVRPARTGQARP